MKRTILVLGLFVTALAACGEGAGLPPRSNAASSGTSGAGPGGAGGQGGAGGIGGAGGVGGAGGQGGAGGKPAPVCGDDALDPDEECDDGNGDAGDGCSPECTVELGEIEPNDTPGQASPYKDPFPAKINPEGDVDFVSFTVAAANTSVIARILDVGDGGCATGAIDTVLEIRAADGTTILASDDDAGEGACSRAVLPSLTPGAYLARIVASASASSPTFVYRLRIDQVVDVCGDGQKTPAEACDDGNTAPGDGCSPTCSIEITETEPNGTAATADAFLEPWNGVLTPLGDVDVVSVVLSAPAASLTATTTDQGTNACAAKTLDTIVDILAPNGTTVLATGDDIVGNCGSALAMNLAAGTYFVRMRGGSLAKNPSPYGLQIVIQ
ncbi:myxococcus cysteine-rich repeat containing protein [Polyangium jinanense]|uniref:DVUA0089 family protein n=1 Tax=Polyangium jinanense TaxID=2829994 RepID=A0A9X3XBM4_9BACT|nr:myxococcus cysteine-rich repeat containing protein [Polyangium jinanense]MDC3957448.1 DVUA0089 family protein [Polyangium jinanense]MDC3985061.1 DVUA0089 family protein [Polyangium jinanense]